MEQPHHDQGVAIDYTRYIAHLMHLHGQQIVRHGCQQVCFYELTVIICFKIINRGRVSMNLHVHVVLIMKKKMRCWEPVYNYYYNIS